MIDMDIDMHMTTNMEIVMILTPLSVYSKLTHGRGNKILLMFMIAASLLIGFYMNGCLHWVAYKGSDCFWIVAFDLGNENFEELSPLLLIIRLFLVGVSVCLLHKVVHRLINWMMMVEYWASDSWTKFTIYTTMQLFALIGNEEVFLAMGQKSLGVCYATRKSPRDMVVCGVLTWSDVWATYVESLVSPVSGKWIRRQGKLPFLG